jgi:acetylornithine deacetylase/succinyl-diaminopimelate desuccinylase-like protein
VYDHYDVQPPEPLEGWASPAFEPTLRDGGGARGPTLHARGVADNKGNLMLRLQAIESWLATEGELPITTNFLIEGEEEIGSVHLDELCHQFRMVPDQDPNEIVAALRAHLDEGGFSDIAIVELGHERAARSPTDALPTRAMAVAIRQIYGQDPVIYPYMENQYRGFSEVQRPLCA